MTIKAATIAYGGLQMSLLIFSTIATKAKAMSVPSAAVVFLSALCIGALSFLEHSRSARPSILLNSYLFITTLFDIIQTRTMWLSSETNIDIISTRLLTASVAIKTVLILLESQQKSKWIQWDVKEHSPEETSGVFGLAAFAWLNRIFATGYRRIMTIDDIFPLDQCMSTEPLELKLMDRLKAPGSKRQTFRLAKALARTLTIPLLLPIGPRVALIACKFGQPFLIQTLLDFLKHPADHASKNIGYALIGITVLIYSGMAASNALYWYFHERTLCMSRGALAGAVYKKTTEAKLSTADDSAALTLMSGDIERIRLGFLNFHELWANAVEVGLASWLLQGQLGVAFAAPLLVVLCCIICASFANRFTGQRQKEWMERIQKRVGLTANMVSHMKHLKISGLTVPVENLIQNMRTGELKAASRYRTVYITVCAFGYVPLALSPVMTFAVTARTLDVTTIFTSVSYLLLLTDPLGYLFQNIPPLLAAFACLDRIQAFLDKEPRLDFRHNASDIRIENGGGDNLVSAMSISSGYFGWDADKLILKNINIDIPASRLTVVIGPVASGKSTLCKVLLGEVPVSQGQVAMHLASCKVGFCDQTPYLSNTTVRENILGFSTYNQQRYKEVIRATMLEQDLAGLPNGDETRVGSNGITLSGGQRQRVSMARALYLDSSLFIFDDILSGLDADTEEQVFRRVFRSNGLLQRRNATAVLCTHNHRHLPHADHIIVLGADGHVVEQGTFHNLIANKKYVASLGISSIDDVMCTDGDSAVETRELAWSRPSSMDRPVASSYIDAKRRNRGDLSVWLYYLASLGKMSVAVFAICSLGWGFFYNWGTVWLKIWSEDVSSSHPSRSNSFYIGFYALFQMSFLVSLFLAFFVCFRTMIQISGAKLHKVALGTLFAAPLRFFTTTDTGLITNLFSTDMALVDTELPVAVVNLSLDICNALGMAAVIATSSSFLAISYPFIFVILYGVQKVYLRTSRQLRLLDIEFKGPL
jgi:ATP-binding cassette subfamily C (CFTR/MRP) protein 1